MFDEKIPIPKLSLDGSNWVTYRDRLTSAVRSCDLDDHLTSAVITQECIDDGIINNRSPQRRWRAEEKIVKALIESSVPDIIFNDIKDLPTAKEAWDAVIAKFSRTTEMSLTELCRQFQNSHCPEDGNVRTHYNMLTELHQKMAALGATISDEDYATTLKAALPSSYSATLIGIATIRESTGNPVPSSTVIRFVLDEYEWHVKEKATQEEFEAMFAQVAASRGFKRARDDDTYHAQVSGRPAGGASYGRSAGGTSYGRPTGGAGPGRPAGGAGRLPCHSHPHHASLVHRVPSLGLSPTPSSTQSHLPVPLPSPLFRMCHLPCAIVLSHLFPSPRQPDLILADSPSLAPSTLGHVQFPS